VELSSGSDVALLPTGNIRRLPVCTFRKQGGRTPPFGAIPDLVVPRIVRALGEAPRALPLPYPEAVVTAGAPGVRRARRRGLTMVGDCHTLTYGGDHDSEARPPQAEEGRPLQRPLQARNGRPPAGLRRAARPL